MALLPHGGPKIDTIVVRLNSIKY